MRDKNSKKIIFKRVASIFIAVIFMCGTAFIPSGVYATDGMADEASTGAEQISEQTDQMSEQAEQNTTVPQTDEVGSNTEIDDLLIMPEDNEAEYDGFIYKLEDDATKKEIQEMENEIEDLNSNQEVEEITNNELYVADSLDTIDSVADTEIVQYIEPNYTLSSTATPNDKYYSKDGWSLKMMNVPEVWDQNMFGEGTTIAVLDTGTPNHEDIDSSKFVDAANFSSSNTIFDTNGHSTAVIGAIAATYNNGIGFAGAMPEAKIMPIKVLGNDRSGDTAGVLAGINHALNHHADVINMSLGGPNSSLSLKEGCERATQAGIVVVASAGNEGDEEDENGTVNPIIYPAAYDCVVSVASVNRAEEHSSFSTNNNKVTVAAPGESVCVPKLNNEYTRMNGTSIASPEVAALAGMVKSMYSGATTSEFVNILKQTSKDAGTPGYDNYFGYGIVDYERVYEYMKNNIETMDVQLSSNDYTYNGGIMTPSVTVKQGDNILTEGEDYTVSYSNGRVSIGTYTVKVSAVDSSINDSPYFGEKTVSFRINPPLVKRLKTPSRGKKKLTVRWYSMSKKQKNAYKYLITGYQVRVSLYSNFAGAKYGSINGYSRTSKTIYNLAKKRKYYVQYRSYKTIGGVTYYSNWSSARTRTTK